MKGFKYHKHPWEDDVSDKYILMVKGGQLLRALQMVFKLLSIPMIITLL